MNILSSIRNRFLTIFGDIKVFKFPLFMMYDPGSYKVQAHEIRTVIESLQKGDLLVRGYTNYLDGYFIPGYFSHVALYLGEIDEKDKGLIPENTEDHFYQGKQVFIHAIAQGVLMDDILNFCKCDYLLILRRNQKTEPNLDIKSSFETTKQKALNNLGKGYDFKFDFSDLANFCCTEFVYVCYQELFKQYNVFLKKRRVVFKKRPTLIPDDFVTHKFETVFISKSVNTKKLQKIMQKNSQTAFVK